jgi:hypothetical protein
MWYRRKRKVASRRRVNGRGGRGRQPVGEEYVV